MARIDFIDLRRISSKAAWEVRTAADALSRGRLLEIDSNQLEGELDRAIEEALQRYFDIDMATAARKD